MKQFVFHVAGLPHLAVSKSNNFCAYTMKAYNFCRMMKMLGHRVLFYGPEMLDDEKLDDGVCDEYITTLTAAERQELLGPYTHRSDWMMKLDCNGQTALWRLSNAKAAAAMMARRVPGHDFICITYGYCQLDLKNAFAANDFVVEIGIGYGGTIADFRVFESYSHMHQIYGASQGFEPSGRWYDVVIPNYFDPADFGYHAAPEADLLYLGRMIQRKGLEVVAAVGKATGRHIKLAGPGAKKIPGGAVTTDGFTFAGEFEYVGVANVETRRQLLQNATALICPTQYVEPFGGVAVEAQLCGTPVITVDWGAFTETVEHGVTGYRCRTLDHFVNAVRMVADLDRAEIYRRAAARWGLQRVMWQYQEYFTMLDDLREELGWGKIGRRNDLDWLRKE